MERIRFTQATYLKVSAVQSKLLADNQKVLIPKDVVLNIHSYAQDPNTQHLVVTFGLDDNGKQIHFNGITRWFVFRPHALLFNDKGEVLTGDIKAIYHTHPIGSSDPSYADRVGCMRSQIPWVICSPLNKDFQVIYPDDPLPEKPLLGRPFCWGIFDCYSLVQDYYKEEFKIILPDYDRGMLFQWDIDPKWNHFEDKFRDFGFYELPEDAILKKGDIFLMSIGSRKVNHCAVLHQLDRNIFYHHLLDHLSEAAVYGGQWKMLTRRTLRHKDLA